MTSILSFIVVLGVLIFVHEFGHFLFAKLFRVGVEKFSLGFGPRIVGRQIGETEYRISAFPLGGYVKMVGENGEEDLPPEDVDRSFMAKPPLQRVIIVAAGPVFNLLFAYLAFTVICMIGIPSATSKIGDVMKDKPAARAGIEETGLPPSTAHRFHAGTIWRIGSRPAAGGPFIWLWSGTENRFPYG